MEDRNLGFRIGEYLGHAVGLIGAGVAIYMVLLGIFY